MLWNLCATGSGFNLALNLHKTFFCTRWDYFLSLCSWQLRWEGNVEHSFAVDWKFKFRFSRFSIVPDNSLPHRHTIDICIYSECIYVRGNLYANFWHHLLWLPFDESVRIALLYDFPWYRMQFQYSKCLEHKCSVWGTKKNIKILFKSRYHDGAKINEFHDCEKAYMKRKRKVKINVTRWHRIF